MFVDYVFVLNFSLPDLELLFSFVYIYIFLFYVYFRKTKAPEGNCFICKHGNKTFSKILIVRGFCVFNLQQTLEVHHASISLKQKHKQ